MTLETILSSGILNYLVGFLIVAGIYALFTLGLNVHFGETGLINFGIAGFFAIGAYTAALVTKPLPTGELARYTQQALGLNQPFLVGVIAAAVVCGIVAVLIGIPTLRLREDYLAIATIGIAESIRLVFNNEQWLANGSKGLVGIPRPFYDLVPPAYYNYVYLGIVVLVLAFVAVLLERMIRSPWGRVLRAIREDEVVAAAYGKNVFGFKLQALVLGAMVMGVGGALYAHNAGTISPTVFEPVFGTFIVWVMLILGGSGNTKGVILGAFVFWAIWAGTQFATDALVPPAFSARAPYFRFLLMETLLVLMLLFRPKGILGEERFVSTLRPQ